MRGLRGNIYKWNITVDRCVDQFERAIAVAGQLRLVVVAVLPVAVQEHDQRQQFGVLTPRRHDRAIWHGRCILGLVFAQFGVSDCHAIRTEEHLSHGQEQCERAQD